MTVIFPKILLLISTAIGLLLLYASLFVYEDEQKKVQNWIDDAIKRSKGFESIYSKTNFIVSDLYQKFNNLLHSIFGKSYFSLQTIGRLGLLSTGSFFIVLAILTDWLLGNSAIYFFVSGVIVFNIGFVSGRKKKLVPFYLLVSFIVLGVIWSLINDKIAVTIILTLTTITTIFLSVLSGITTLILIDKGAKNTEAKKNWISVLLTYLVTLIIIVAFYAFTSFLSLKTVPLIIKIKPDSTDLTPIFIYAIVIIASIGTFFYLLLFDLLFIMILFLLPVNKYLWHLVRFFLRFSYEHNLIKSRKILGSIGVLFLSFAFPQIKDLPILSKLLEIFDIK